MRIKDDTVVSLQHISKAYTVDHRARFMALDDVTLDIQRGDRVGIIGLNGAGKTTLLKIIGGITKPTSGKVLRNGKVVSLIDLEAGFEPELTGFENIMVNGLIIGMDRKEILAKIGSIVEFADIGNFVHRPFRTYSSGMKFRLAIAVAIASEADILIVDELFINSDWEFQKKMTETIRKLQRNRKITTIICSHAPVTLVAFADIFYKIHKGKISPVPSRKVKQYAIYCNAHFHKTFKSDWILDADLQVKSFRF
jgi:ABC-type polysaccharide/polyol phosphate transport system ATPase subunit